MVEDEKLRELSKDFLLDNVVGYTYDSFGEIIHKFKFYKKLNMLTVQQFQILRKQAVSGDIDGAERQFQKMIGRVKLYD